MMRFSALKNHTLFRSGTKIYFMGEGGGDAVEFRIFKTQKGYYFNVSTNDFEFL